MANEYVTQAELKATLSLTGETYADADIDLALTAASRALDDATGRRFFPDADANQVRWYTPRSDCQVIIDDLVEFTSLKTDHDGDGIFEQTWVLNTDFVLHPLNAVANGRPWERFEVLETGNLLLPIRYRVRSVQVTGKFGWLAVPPGIKQATSLVATRLLKRSREAPFGVMVFEGTDAAYLARNDPDVQILIGDLDRTLLG